MKAYDIKLIKYGIVFFYDSATLRYDASGIEITKEDGEIVFKHSPSEIKRVIFNPSSGIFTLKTYSGQKVNMSFKGDFTLQKFEPVDKFYTYLKQQRVKGYSIGYMTFGKF